MYGPNGRGGLYIKDPMTKLWWHTQVKRQWKDKPTKEAISVIVEFTFKDKRRRDLDNFNKVLLDSCTGIIWEDDSQIWELILRKFVGTEAKTDVFIM